MAKVPGADLRRRLPAVEEVLQRPEVAALVGPFPRSVVLRHVRALLSDIRAKAGRGDEPQVDRALQSLSTTLSRSLEASSRPSLVPVINATGVVVHTNLGRAPLSPHAAARVAEIAASYSNLEL